MGDHRQPAADITVDSLLGRKLPRIAPPKARKLNSKSGKSCDEYIRLLEESTDECKLYDRLLVIAGQKEPDSVAEFTCEQAEEALEKIDKLLTMLMLWTSDYDDSEKQDLGIASGEEDDQGSLPGGCSRE